MMTRSAWDLLDLANEVMAAGIVVYLVYRLGYRRGNKAGWRGAIGELDELHKVLAAEAPERPK